MGIYLAIKTFYRVVLLLTLTFNVWSGKGYDTIVFLGIIYLASQTFLAIDSVSDNKIFKKRSQNRKQQRKKGTVSKKAKRKSINSGR